MSGDYVYLPKDNNRTNNSYMKRILLATLLAALAGTALAQHPQHCGRHPHCGNIQQLSVQPLPRVNADGIDMAIVAAFPTVKSVKKTDRWTEVHDKDGKLLGYVVYSKPASDGIKGYNGETPVLIALSTKKIITGVYALPNTETPRFAQHVQQSGFYDNWNGLSIKKARKKKVDTVSGATFTSRAVALSVQAALEKL